MRSISTGEPWFLGTAIVVFLAAGVLVAIAGARLVRIADRLADRTGWGEAMFGAVFIGATTSLPGLVTSVTAAANGFPELAVSNAIGGIAAQTAFLSVADIAYRKANLEHAAAEPENMTQGALLISLLALVLGTALASPVSIWGIHPTTLILPIAYIGGVRMIRDMRDQPMWRPRKTALTRPDIRAAPVDGERVARLWLRFALYVPVLIVAGWLIARAGESVALRTGLTETGVGALFTAVATSLPELFTAIAAVRAGALTLAVGNILGGNFFDTLFVAAADIAFRPGSIYHAASQSTLYLMALALLLTGVLLLGLLRREPHGIGNIGFESFLVLVLFVMGYVVLFVG